MSRDPALAEIQQQLADLTARLERARVVKAKPRTKRKKGKRVVLSLPPTTGPKPSDLAVRRAKALLRKNGWHEYG